MLIGIAIVERDLEFFTTSYRYIVQILPSLIVAPLYFANKVELGAISQSYGAFNHILGDFSIIINQFESLSKFSAGLNRLVTFIDKIDECKGWGSSTSTSVVATNGDITSHSGVTDFNSSLIGMRVVGPNSMLSLSTVSDSTSAVKNNQIPTFDSNKEVILKCSDLTVLTPDRNRVLLGQVADLSLSSQYKKRERGVELEVYNGDKLLIVGPSGAGKSSLVRAIAGLWQVGGGTINWSDGLYPANSLIANAITNLPANQTGISIASAPKSVFFLPQKPYNFLGTLREQIMYPKVERNTALKKSLSSTAFSNIGESSTKAKFSSIYNAKLPIDSIVRTISKDDYAGEDHSDDYFLELLEKVRLGDLAARMGNGDPIQGLDSNKDWSKVLSLGEQQRLAFARVMYNKPQVVVLDGTLYDGKLSQQCGVSMT